MEKEKFQEFLKTADSQSLANIVLIYRVLGTLKEDAKQCMIELMKRKGSGDTFDFKSFIDENYNKLKINVNLQSPKNIKHKISTNVMEGVIGGFMSEAFSMGKSCDGGNCDIDDEDDD